MSALLVCTVHRGSECLKLKNIQPPVGFVECPLLVHSVLMLNNECAVPITTTAAVEYFVHCFKGDRGWMKWLINCRIVLVDIIKILILMIYIEKTQRSTREEINEVEKRQYCEAETWTSSLRFKCKDLTAPLSVNSSS